MRKTLFLPLLVLLLLWQVPSYADSAQDAEFHRGFEAYRFSNYSKAFEILKPLADSGHGPAQYWFGGLYYNGYGVAKDKSEAKKWYGKAFESLKRSAERGDASAQHWLGASYEYGIGVAKDKSEAEKWFRKAFESFKPLAESGNANAQLYLGNIYYSGYGVAKDEREAFKWYLKAAKQGNARAQDKLANMYNNGEGVEKDKSKAFRWYLKMAQQGYAFAQDQVAWMYNNGDGVKKDKYKAKQWFRKAIKSLKPLAESGSSNAKYDIGYLYDWGYGVAEDESEAFKWWLKAAKQGHVYAQRNVADGYLKGRGVTYSLVDAYVWYSATQQSGLDDEDITKKLKSIEEQLSPEQLQQLIEQGNAGAQYRRGEIYEEGKDVPESLFDAYIWYIVAKINGYNDSEKRAEAIEEKLIPAEIQQAKAKAKQCIESNYKNCSWKTASDSNKDDKFKRGIEAYDAEDYRKAFQIWKDSAESGHVKSQYYLGIMYYEGKGTIRNYKKAHLWYYNAAKQGHVAAQSKLGTMYSEGKGVPQDSINAYMWHSVAAANGADSNSLDYLERILSPQQLDQALAKSEQCFNSNYKNCD